MTILLSDAGKRFNREWIFRHFNYNFHSGNSYAIVGPNGSGKSTLLQAIAGALALSEGNLECSEAALTYSHDGLFQYLAIAAPYLEVIEEMTAIEFLQFHQRFKSFLPGLSTKESISIIGLDNAAHKQIRYYSSGMKQRVKLAQAIFSDVPIVLLDEPCTNLDAPGIALYQQLVQTYCKDRLLIISSNDELEYGFCTNRVNMMEWKK